MVKYISYTAVIKINFQYDKKHMQNTDFN